MLNKPYKAIQLYDTYSWTAFVWRDFSNVSLNFHPRWWLDQQSPACERNERGLRSAGPRWSPCSYLLFFRGISTRNHVLFWQPGSTHPQQWSYRSRLRRSSWDHPLLLDWSNIIHRLCLDLWILHRGTMWEVCLFQDSSYSNLVLSTDCDSITRVVRSLHRNEVCLVFVSCIPSNAMRLFRNPVRDNIICKLTPCNHWTLHTSKNLRFSKSTNKSAITSVRITCPNLIIMRSYA